MQAWNPFLESEISAPAYAAKCSAKKAFFHVIPVPYEESVSYGGGTAYGPDAILEASTQLELWDGASIPAELGIYTAEAVDCNATAQEVLDRIYKASKKALARGGLPILLGGEHTVTYGALRALKEQREASGKAPFGVVQFDAHADLRDSYEGSKWSHACVMRRAVNTAEQDPDGLGLPLAQFGVRAMGLDEIAFRKTAPVHHWDAAELAKTGVDNIALPDNFPEDIYITFDVDGLDPSIMPATGTPVPGGLGWYEALTILERVIAGRSVIGFDVVELAPIDVKAGGHAWSFTAARLVYAIMGMIQRFLLR